MDVNFVQVDTFDAYEVTASDFLKIGMAMSG
jgi:hypothetical protein